MARVAPTLPAGTYVQVLIHSGGSYLILQSGDNDTISYNGRGTGALGPALPWPLPKPRTR